MIIAYPVELMMDAFSLFLPPTPDWVRGLHETSTGLLIIFSEIVIEVDLYLIISILFIRDVSHFHTQSAKASEISTKR